MDDCDNPTHFVRSLSRKRFFTRSAQCMRRIRKIEQSRNAYWYENKLMARLNKDSVYQKHSMSDIMSKLAKWLLASPNAAKKYFMQ